MITINFEDTFEPVEVAKDLSFITFYSIDSSRQNILIKVKIEPLGDPLLPNVCNLSFGPLKTNGEIDDAAKIMHYNTGKMFSTVLIACLFFLQQNPHLNIGLDGSNDARAYLYHRMFQTNKEPLAEFFVSIGVDWYVRLLRSNEIERDEHGYAFFKPRPEPFDYKRPGNDLYRYYMFNLRKQSN